MPLWHPFQRRNSSTHLLSTSSSASSITKPISRTSISRDSTTFLEDTDALEEETLPTYRPHAFYPAHISEKIQSRYRLLGKLSYDAHGTTWFCHDTKTDRYRYMTICATTCPDRQWKVFSKLQARHAGKSERAQGLMVPVERFHITSPVGSCHQCFVFESVGPDVGWYVGVCGRWLDIKWRRDVVRAILMGLDFLHWDVGVAHGDVRGANVRLKVLEGNEFWERAQIGLERRRVGRRCLNVRDGSGGRIVYKSVDMDEVVEWDYATTGAPVLAGVGLPPPGGIERWKAPEAIMGAKSGKSADIWGFAVLAWEIMTERKLFDFHKREDDRPDEMEKRKRRLIDAISKVIGPPPEEVDERKQKCPHDSVMLEQDRKRLESGLDVNLIFRDVMSWQLRADLLDFMRSMLKWRRQDRASTKELLQHPFMDPNNDDGQYYTCKTV